MTFAEAVRKYQCDNRDRNMSYCYPIEELSRIHGTGKRKFWALCDENGFCGTVFFRGVKN